MRTEATGPLWRQAVPRRGACYGAGMEAEPDEVDGEARPWQSPDERTASIEVLADTVQMWSEMVIGHRTRLVAGGMSEQVAEQMCLQLHIQLCGLTSRS